MDPLVGVGRKGLVIPFSPFLLSTCSVPGLVAGGTVCYGKQAQGSAGAVMCGGKSGERHPKSKLKL